MAFTITKPILDEIANLARAVEAELQRSFAPHEIDLIVGDAFAAAGDKFDPATRQAFADSLSRLDDVMLAEAAAISLAGDGSYAPEEIEELVGSLVEGTDRSGRMKILTNEPHIGSMFVNGMRALGLDS